MLSSFDGSFIYQFSNNMEIIILRDSCCLDIFLFDHNLALIFSFFYACFRVYHTLINSFSANDSLFLFPLRPLTHIALFFQDPTSSTFTRFT